MKDTRKDYEITKQAFLLRLVRLERMQIEICQYFVNGQRL